jgi:hypothetical protein
MKSLLLLLFISASSYGQDIPEIADTIEYDTVLIKKRVNSEYFQNREGSFDTVKVNMLVTHGDKSAKTTGGYMVNSWPTRVFLNCRKKRLPESVIVWQWVIVK